MQHANEKHEEAISSCLKIIYMDKFWHEKAAFNLALEAMKKLPHNNEKSLSAKAEMRKIYFEDQ